MVSEPKTIRLEAGSELDRLLDVVSAGPVILERDGARFRLDHDAEDPWATYDPEAVRQAFRNIAGRWADRDVKQMIADVYRARDEGSEPPDRKP